MRRRKRRSRRIFLVLAAAVALSVGLVALGRAEGERAVDRQLRGIASVRREVERGTVHTPAAYRLTPTLDCLLYRRGVNRFALELCYDRQGGLVEAIDRRRLTPTFWDIEYDPNSAEYRVSPVRLSNVLRSMGAFKLLHIPPGVLPSGVQDYGPQVSGAPYPVPNG